jgi:hypothetical protein
VEFGLRVERERIVKGKIKAAWGKLVIFQLQVKVGQKMQMVMTRKWKKRPVFDIKVFCEQR